VDNPIVDEMLAKSPAGLVHQPPTAQASIVPLPPARQEDEFGGFGEGHDGAHASDNVMPRVSLLQGGSPEVKQKLATDGDFMIKSTGQVIKGETGFLFLPVWYRRTFLHWNNRQDKGGNNQGLIREYPDNDPFVRDILTKRLGNPDAAVFGPVPVDETPGQASSLVETKTLFGLMVDEDGQASMVTIPCESSKIKAYNGAVSAMQRYRHPGRSGKLNTYNFLFRVSTKLEQDKKSSQWFAALKINPANGALKDSLVSEKTNPELLGLARELLADIKTGKKKAEEATQSDFVSNDADEGGYVPDGNVPPPPTTDGKGTTIPF
jgi:hypothetical protein